VIWNSTLRRTPVRRRRRGPPRRGPSEISPEMWRNEEYRDFLREHGYCIACFLETGRRIKGNVVVAHGPVSGTSSKGPDSEAIPLCAGFGTPDHHALQHRLGWTEFEVKYGFCREVEARTWWVAYTIWKEEA